MLVVDAAPTACKAPILMIAGRHHIARSGPDLDAAPALSTEHLRSPQAVTGAETAIRRPSTGSTS